MKKFVVVILSVIAFLILAFAIFYNINLKAVGSSEEVDYIVENGSTYYSVISDLKEKGLIRNELCFKLYIKFNSVSDIKAGLYKLNKNMSVSDIVNIFNKGNTYNPDAVRITFKEGKNMRSIASVIEKNTNNTSSDVFNLLKDKVYLQSLIDEYWFITVDILNQNIYYPLEGYLYPNTYEFKNKDVTVKEIFKTMLDEMDKNLKDYKKDIENNKYSFHEILTLASMGELEGKFKEDRVSIIGLFINRLNLGMSLGSDVTTYYGSKIDNNERDLYQNELDDPNAYNTRGNNLPGKLPVGPVCNPSIETIKAAIYPEDNDYIYFVSDKNGKVYFTKTYNDHINKRSELIEAGLWYTYE